MSIQKTLIYPSLIFIYCFLFSQKATAQVLKTSTGNVVFKSKTLTEEIVANNSQVSAAISPSKNQMQFRVPINGFQFKSALMQKHFNENYMETSTYPTADFLGEIKNINDVKFEKEGEYPVNVLGKLSIHGVTKEVNTSGTILVKTVGIQLKSSFKIKCSDFGIEIPLRSIDSISDGIAIDVNCVLTQ